MTKFIVFDKAGETEPVVRLRLEESLSGCVKVVAVKADGTFQRNLLEITEQGIARFPAAHVDGIAFDENGRISVVD